MSPLSSIRNARSTLQRWLLGPDEGFWSDDHPAKGTPAKEHDDSPQARISQFIEELNASSQEWLGRVRMINLESVRDRMGPRWPKLQAKVEILVEKIIHDETGPHDRNLKIGDAEFLVFFGDATPEESRIRCFAIVEAIHEKLFGLSEAPDDPGWRGAECHVIHRDDLALMWEEANAARRTLSDDQNLAVSLRESVRHEAEVLDEDEITQSTQRIIDAIISSGAQSQNISSLGPLSMRLKLLARNLKALEPALAGARASPNSRNSEGIFGAGHNRELSGTAVENVALFGTAWEDIAELTSILDIGSHHSHAAMLAALGRLQRFRLERASTALDADALAPARYDARKDGGRQFIYTPIYRSVSRGERIHQGIYRVECMQDEHEKPAGNMPVQSRKDMLALERATLEHAIRYLLDRTKSDRFMLMVAVHVETLRGPNSQLQYSTILRSARLRAKRRLLIEVTGFSDTDDTIGTRRAINELGVHCHAVFISVSPKGVDNLEKTVMECKRPGIHAWGIDVSEFEGRNRATFDLIARLSSLGLHYSIPTFVDGIRDVPVLSKAIATGISYVCAPLLRPPVRTPDDAQHTSLEDLYVAI